MTGEANLFSCNTHIYNYIFILKRVYFHILRKKLKVVIINLNIDMSLFVIDIIHLKSILYL